MLILKRYIFFICGLFFNAVGIALITKSGLGTSPISSLPYVLTFILPCSFGTFTFLVNLGMLMMQKMILGRYFSREQYLQIPVTIIFSLFIDFSMYVLQALQPLQYIAQMIILFGGCFLLGCGVAIEVLAGVVVLPGEGAVNAIAFRWKKDFGVVKTYFDSSLVLTATLLSILFLGEIEGLREGTFIAALTVGTIARGCISCWEKFFRK